MPNNAPQKSPEISKNKCLILVDGYGFLFRAYHSMPPLTRKDGTPTGAVYGFCNMLMKLLGDHEGDYIAVALDAGKKTFRNDIYADYKANRPPAPDDLIPQFPLVREAVEAFNLPSLQVEGFEADDLIATYTRQATQMGLDVLIVSSDKDLMQLVDDNVTMFDPLKSRFIKHEQVVEKFGVAPELVLDILSLMGDSSDNIPGVPGIGPKIAAELINQYGSLDALLERTSEVKQNKRRENLEKFKDQALLSRELASLSFEAPMQHTVEALEFKSADNVKLAKFLAEQGFKKLLARVDAGASFELSTTQQNIIKKQNDYTFKMTSFDELDGFKQWLASFNDVENLSLTLDTIKSGEIVGIAVAINIENTAYLAISSNESVENNAHGDLFGDSTASNSNDADALTITHILESLKPLLERKDVWKITHEAKALLHLAYANNIQPSSLEDVMLMAYLLGGTTQKLDIASLASEHLDIALEKIDDKSEKDVRHKTVAESVFCLGQLAYQFKSDIVANQLTSLYERIERPLVEVLARMEFKGITLDRMMLKQMSDAFSEKLTLLEKEIHEQANCEFNIGSPKQLGEVLFEKMGIEGGKKSKSGSYGTDASILEAIAANGHTIADNILEWRQISKLKSTYTDALPKQIKNDGRVHTHYAMASTSTGRLSSNAPNLQNIPTRTEEGNKIRKTFIAAKGKKLISADYSQIELRLLAHMADIGTLKQAFKDGLDIHSATASQVFNIPLADIDSETRRKAKAINFGIIYGMSAFGLANRLRISRTDAKHYIETYFKQYPGIRHYMDQTIEYAKEHGYVKTLFGRKCFVRDINAKNPALKQFSERAAINAPLQGTAADIIKKAMIKLQDAINKKGLKADILLQVHDELIIEADESAADEMVKTIQSVMESAANLSVPLTVDVGIGNNWAEIH